jgi:3'-5' exoribonuclease 1
MNYIVFDLEATCWETDQERKNKKQEIIEIGAVKIDENGKVLGRFESFIRPEFHPNLTDFCKRLTNIKQTEVNSADVFPIVIEEFVSWISEEDTEEFCLCSWGDFDRKALISNCRFHDLDFDWAEAHVNLKAQYASLKGLKKEIGMSAALERENLEFTGNPHRANDDAYNLVKIFLRFFHAWEIY